MAVPMQLKRTSVSGRTPNTTSSGNSSYIAAGELAINLTDGKLFSSNGTALIYIGGNVATLNVSSSVNLPNTVTISGTSGTNGQYVGIVGSNLAFASLPPTIAVYDAANTLLSNSYFITGSSINQLSDVDTVTTAPANNDLLSWSNAVSNWVPSSNLSLRSLNVTYTPATTTGVALTLTAANSQGGTNYADVFKLINSSTGATANTKTIRLNPTGSLEILNNAYSAVVVAVSDAGNLTTAGTVTPGAWTAGQVIKDTMLSNTDLTVLATTVATSTSDTDFLSYSYTPVSSSSYLIIHVHVGSYEAGKTAGSGTDSYFSRIKVDGNEITYSSQYTRDTYTNRTGVLFPLTGRYTNSNTAAKAITVGVRRDTADDNITITNSATALWMRITEIAR